MKHIYRVVVYGILSFSLAGFAQHTEQDSSIGRAPSQEREEVASKLENIAQCWRSDQPTLECEKLLLKEFPNLKQRSQKIRCIMCPTKMSSY